MTLRGSLFANVPLLLGTTTGPPDVAGIVLGDTLAGAGGLPFWFSGGNTTRGPPPDPALLMSTGASSRGMIFSVPSPDGMRSGVLLALSAGCGTILYSERRGQTGGHVDSGVAIMDGLWCLVFIIPGLVGFIVDFGNGAIYEPSGR